MKQERRQNGRCNRVARPEKPDRLSEARDFSHDPLKELQLEKTLLTSLILYLVEIADEKKRFMDAKI